MKEMRRQMHGKVLIVDDEETPRALLASELRAAGYEVIQAGDGLEGLQRFDEDRPDLVITDKNMPRRNGLELLADLRERSAVPVIVLTAFGTVSSAVSAMKSGAAEYVSSDEIEIDDLVDLVGQMLLSGDDGSSQGFATVFPGKSPIANAIRTRLKVFAPLVTPVFVQGARGTNKSRLIDSMHRYGSSATGRLVGIEPDELARFDCPVDVTAIHVRSADTLAPDVDAWLCEILERGETRIDSGAIRLFLSSEQSLNATVSKNLSELFAPYVVEVPSLVDHIEDLGEISRVFLAEIARDLARKELALLPDAEGLLASKRWTGNEAELRGVLRRAAILNPGSGLPRATIEVALDEAIASVARIRKLESSRERERLLSALEQAGGVVARASRILGTNRSAIYRMMDRHGIPRDRRT